jgi:hypothetical protein
MKPNGIFVSYTEDRNCIYFKGELRADKQHIPKNRLVNAIAGSNGFRDYKLDKHGVFVKGLIFTDKESMYFEDFQDLLYEFAEEELIKTIKAGATTKACLAAEHAMASLCERIIDFVGGDYE